MPNPSPELGPKPNWRRAGLPQLDVLRMVLFIFSHPESEKMAGICCVPAGLGAGEGETFSSSAEGEELRLGDAALEPASTGEEYPFEDMPLLLAASAPSSSTARCQTQKRA